MIHSRCVIYRRWLLRAWWIDTLIWRALCICIPGWLLIRLRGRRISAFLIIFLWSRVCLLLRQWWRWNHKWIYRGLACRYIFLKWDLLNSDECHILYRYSCIIDYIQYWQWQIDICITDFFRRDCLFLHLSLYLDWGTWKSRIRIQQRRINIWLYTQRVIRVDRPNRWIQPYPI